MSERQEILTGGCQCGAVRFAFYAAPGKISICHCRMCQKAVSGPFAAFVEIPHEDFAWTRGKPATFRSSSIADRDFCAQCGSPLTYRRIGGPKTELLTGTFDEPQRLVPTHETGTESKMNWLGSLDRLISATTEQNAGATFTASIVSYQHPDHNT